MRPASRYLPAVLLGAAILSVAGSLGSPEITGRLASPFLEGFLGLSPEVAEALHRALRKTGHFLAYALFAWTALRAVAGPRPPVTKDFLRAGLLCFLLAAVDESLQHLSPSRTGKSLDVLLDAAGAASALLVLRRLASRRSRAA